MIRPFQVIDFFNRVGQLLPAIHPSPVHYVAMMYIAFHRVLAMVGKLGVKPLVKRRYQGWIEQLGAAFDVVVVDLDLSGLGGFEFSQAGHVLAMDVRRA